MVATIGDDRLVPPTTNQPPRFGTPIVYGGVRFGVLYESYTARPVPGSASAETSATLRRGQPASCCHAGLGSKSEHPLPDPLQAVSLKPRAVSSAVSVVPPTAVTYGDD